MKSDATSVAEDLPLELIDTAITSTSVENFSAISKSAHRK